MTLPDTWPKGNPKGIFASQKRSKPLEGKPRGSHYKRRGWGYWHPDMAEEKIEDHVSTCFHNYNAVSLIISR